MDRMLCSSKDVGEGVMVEVEVEGVAVGREGGRRNQRVSMQRKLLFTAMGNGGRCQDSRSTWPLRISAELLF